ncbi:MAG TPA: hypothetical protein VGB72_08420 [Acidobacteriota bacterium]
MRTFKIVVLALLVGFLLGAVLPAPAAQRQNSPNQKEDRVFIPKEIKAVLEGGLMAKQARSDIPFSVTGNIYLPAVGAYHNVISLDIKNADLGFVQAAPPAAVPAKEEPAPKKEPAAPAPEMQATFEIFLQFREISGGLPGQLFREVYVPCQERVPVADFDPNKTETYFLWYPLPAGKYLMAMALTSTDLKKIGTQYFEFNLPDPAFFTDRLEATPIFSSKNIERMEAPETRPLLHKGFFTMAVLKITPNFNNVIAVKDNFDIFFYIFGAKLNAEQKYALEMNFEVKKGEETAIRFAPAVFESPLVSLPLPMKHAVLKQTEAGEVKEENDLAPGKYVLAIKILDKNSGNTLTKNVDFEVK